MIIKIMIIKFLWVLVMKVELEKVFVLKKKKKETYYTSQTSKMKLFAKIVNGCQLLTIFAKVPS